MTDSKNRDKQITAFNNIQFIVIELQLDIINIKQISLEVEEL